MKEFGKAFGESLGPSIGVILVKIIMIFILAMLVLFLLGLIFFGLAFYFYRKIKPKAFLITGLFSSFSFSLLISIIVSSKLAGNFSLVILLTPLLFIVGSLITASFYKKLKGRLLLL